MILCVLLYLLYKLQSHIPPFPIALVSLFVVFFGRALSLHQMTKAQRLTYGVMFATPI